MIDPRCATCGLYMNEESARDDKLRAYQLADPGHGNGGYWIYFCDQTCRKLYALIEAVRKAAWSISRTVANR